ncbi:acyl-CoA carboxylase epsilon subunit [Pseudonocardia alni]|uniref:Acyl-CoA carboxylase epsilon subunit-like protein n=1 Tax=Pseudonocardia alni TaxID=33907 RepID=A0AA44ZNA5_PSEA5|nr:acyl-CoA carboxylase epsilon subunit [Pseudonocardia alni]PKB29617.1 acyl-CoA carboxylase epsilon subunit-like protein [Pseudonocardia alni]
MTTAAGPGPRILITGGNPTPAEVAAVTVALCTLAGRSRVAAGPHRHRRAASWPGADGYRAPTSWSGQGGYQAPASWTART